MFFYNQFWEFFQHYHHFCTILLFFEFFFCGAYKFFHHVLAFFDFFKIYHNSSIFATFFDISIKVAKWQKCHNAVKFFGFCDFLTFSIFLTTFRPYCPYFWIFQHFYIFWWLVVSPCFTIFRRKHFLSFHNFLLPFDLSYHSFLILIHFYSTILRLFQYFSPDFVFRHFSFLFTLFKLYQHFPTTFWQ